MADTMNMREVTVKTFLRIIQEQIEDENLTPIIGLGKSGVGKTESVYGLTQELGIGFKELRLVTMNETDLLGIPMISEERHADGTVSRTTDWASNKMLPIAERDGEIGILVLDEITSASPSIRAAAYQLLDSKRALGNYKLPPKWLIVALGNGPDDGGVFQGMEHAFLNRALCMRVECDAKTWRQWAVSKGVHPAVTGFISFSPEYIHKMNPDDEIGLFPSPRSWVALSKKLQDREKRNGGKPLDDESVSIYSACCVGDEVSIAFSTFYKFTDKVIDVLEVIEGKADLENIPLLQNQVVHLTAQQLAKEAYKLFETDLKNNHGEPTDYGYQCLDNICAWIVALYSRSVDSALIFLSTLKDDVPIMVNEYINRDVDEEKVPNLYKLLMLFSKIFE